MREQIKLCGDKLVFYVHVSDIDITSFKFFDLKLRILFFPTSHVWGFAAAVLLGLILDLTNDISSLSH